METDSNQVALITGATSGIGYELTKCFARDHFDVVIVGRNKKKLVEVANELIESYDVGVKIIAQDLSESGAAKKIKGELDNANIIIDVLVNNAGFGNHGEFSDIPTQNTLDEIQVNLVALTHLTKLLLPGMLKQRRGKILNIGSTASFVPGPYMSIYHATKAYLLSFSQALSEELKHSGVRVSILCPGPVSTNFFKNAGMESTLLARSHTMTAEEVARIGYTSLWQNKRVIIPGWQNMLVAIFSKLLPHSLIMPIVAKFEK